MPQKRGPKPKFPGICNQYLEFMAETGRHERAALACGISYETARVYRKENPDFEKQCQDAERAYHAKIYKLLADQIEKDDANPRFLELELKRIDRSYSEKFQHDVNVKGGGGVIIMEKALTAEELVAEFEEVNAERTLRLTEDKDD